MPYRNSQLILKYFFTFRAELTEVKLVVLRMEWGEKIIYFRDSLSKCDTNKSTYQRRCVPIYFRSLSLTHKCAFCQISSRKFQLFLLHKFCFVFNLQLVKRRINHVISLWIRHNSPDKKWFRPELNVYKTKQNIA